MMADAKRCEKCGRVQPTGEFNKSKRTRDGLQRWCRDCWCAYRVEHKDHLHEVNRQWRSEHVEEVAARLLAWRKEHTEDLTRKRRAKYEREAANIARDRQENPDKYRDRDRRYREAHGEELREYQRTLYYSNPRYRASDRAWRRRNPDKVRAKDHRRRVRLLANGGHFTGEEWAELKRRYDYTCLRCGTCEPEIRLTPDHVIPVIQGGANRIENIQPLCLTCNKSKGTSIVDYRT